MSNIFDSHCHPQMEQYNEDRDEVLGRAREAGVGMICVGTDFETSKQAIDLVQKYDGMWATVGLHPNDAEVLSITNNVLREFEDLLKNEKVVAIGEVGIDYYRTTDIDKQERQREMFGKFTELAIKSGKPLIIHGRDSGKGSAGRAHKDILEIFNTKYVIRNTNLQGVAHSFTGSIDDARKYLDLGFYLGFNGILTFTHQYDEVVKYAPLDQILLETDAPFLSPEPFRGNPNLTKMEGGRVRNEPAYIIEVAKKSAQLKNESLEKVIDQTTKNCMKLFQIQNDL